MSVRVDFNLFLALFLLLVAIDDVFIGLDVTIGSSFLEFNNRLSNS